MLTLPIKRKWFLMSINGIKKEEYRDIKPYWTKRFSTQIDFDLELLFEQNDLEVAKQFLNNYPHREFLVKYRNGYSANAPYFIVRVQLCIGKGNKEWGASENETYIFKYLDILEIGNWEGLKNGKIN